jgi:hypothetical protein
VHWPALACTGVLWRALACSGVVDRTLLNTWICRFVFSDPFVVQSNATWWQFGENPSLVFHQGIVFFFHGFFPVFCVF